jgi:hypothetical protein
MGTKDMHEALKEKDKMLKQQKRRIQILEDKFTELRKKYFDLKYSDQIKLSGTDQ